MFHKFKSHSSIINPNSTLKLRIRDIAYFLTMLAIYAYGALPSYDFVYIVVITIPILFLTGLKYKFHKFTLMNCLLIVFLTKYAIVAYPKATVKNGASVNQVFYLGYIFIVLFLVLSVEGISYKTLFLKGLKFFGKLQVIGVLFQYVLPNVYNAVWGIFCGPNILSNIIRRRGEGYCTGFASESATTALWLSAALGIAFFVENREKRSTKCWIVLYLICLLLTGKRGPFIFAISSLAIVYIIVDRSRLKINSLVRGICAAVAMVIFIFVAYELFGADSPVGRLTETFQQLGQGASVADVSSSRDVLYERAFDYMRGAIWNGIGWGQYRVLSTRLFDFNGDAHNVYIQVFVENGLPGAILYITTMIMGLFYAVRNVLYSQKRRMNVFDECCGLLYLQTYYILYCFSGTCLYEVAFYYMHFIGLMIAQSLWNSHIRRFESEAELV